MKQNIKKWALYLVLLTAALLVGRLYGKIIDRKTEAERIAHVPPFLFQTPSGIPFTQDSVKKFRGLVVFNYFNPDCELCQDMAASYVAHSNLLRGARMIMITTADSGSTMAFIKKYRLQGVSNITVLLTPPDVFENTFGKAIVPSFFVYRNDNLVRKMIGETSIENLLYVHG
jgi:hypothetical protein